jgi:hypothetical protein
MHAVKVPHREGHVVKYVLLMCNFVDFNVTLVPSQGHVIMRRNILILSLLWVWVSFFCGAPTKQAGLTPVKTACVVNRPSPKDKSEASRFQGVTDGALSGQPQKKDTHTLDFDDTLVASLDDLDREQNLCDNSKLVVFNR